MKLINNIGNFLFTYFPIKHDFQKDLGVSLIGKKDNKRKLIDTSKVVYDLSYDASIDNKICYINFKINRPEHNINKLKQRLALIKKIKPFFKRHMEDYNEKSFLRNDIIIISQLGFTYNKYYTEVKIKFEAKYIEFEIKHTKLYEKGLRHEVNQDYQKYKREIEF